MLIMMIDRNLEAAKVSRKISNPRKKAWLLRILPLKIMRENSKNF